MSKDVIEILNLPDDENHKSAVKDMLKHQYKIEK